MVSLWGVPRGLSAEGIFTLLLRSAGRANTRGAPSTKCGALRDACTFGITARPALRRRRAVTRGAHICPTGKYKWNNLRLFYRRLLLQVKPPR